MADHAHVAGRELEFRGDGVGRPVIVERHEQHAAFALGQRPEAQLEPLAVDRLGRFLGRRREVEGKRFEYARAPPPAALLVDDGLTRHAEHERREPLGLAIKAGDWLGAIIGAAGAMVGLGAIAGIGRTAQGAATAFGKIADVAGKVQKVAQAAQSAMAAAKAKNAGSLLAALSAGAGAFASFAGDQVGKFAKTMRSWSDKLDRWSKIITGGQQVAQGIKTGNVGVALAGAFDAAAAAFSKKDADGNETSKKTKDFERYSRMATFVGAGQAAAKSDPPAFDKIVDAAMGLAGELNLIKKGGDAAKITAAATRLGVAIASKDPQAISAAALGLAESIQLAKDNGDDDASGGDEADKQKIMERYARANRVVKIAAQAIQAAAKKPRPDYASALDATAQMVAEFTDDKRLDQAAKVTAAMDKWTKAIQSKNELAILQAGMAFGEAIHGLKDSIQEQRDKSKGEAQAQLAPGEKLPDDAGDVPSFEPGAVDVLPSNPIDPGIVGSIPAIDPSSPLDPGTRASGRSDTLDANYTVVTGDTLSGIALRFKTSVATLRTLNGQLVNDTITYVIYNNLSSIRLQPMNHPELATSLGTVINMSTIQCYM